MLNIDLLMVLLNRIMLPVILGATVFLFGCQKKAIVDSDKVLNYSQIDEPRSLDPAFVKDLYEGIVSGFLFSGLVQFGTGEEIEPALAESWTVLDEGKTYRFKLRENGKFSDGTPITSEDVKYSLSRILAPATVSQRKWVLDRIEGAEDFVAGKTHELAGVQILSANEVVIKLSRPYPPFLQMLAMPNAVIIPKNSAGSGTPDPGFTARPVGAGPWVLHDWLTDQKIVFTANPHYWGSGPQIPTLVYNIQTEDNVRYRQFDAGNLDIMQIGFQVHEKWMKDPKLKAMTTTVQELRTDYIGFNCAHGLLKKPEIRNAIATAINREQIFESVQKGRGVLADSVVPRGIMRSGSYKVAPIEYNPDSARQVFQSYREEDLVFDLWYREEPQTAETAAIIKENLEAAGLQVRLILRDQAGLRQGIHDGAAHMYIGSWTLDYPDIENAVYPPFHSRNIPRQGNMTRYHNEKVDKLLDEAREETDNEQRLAKYDEAAAIVEKDKPWIPLYNRQVVYAVKPQVKNWVPALIYNADRFNTVTKTQSKK